MPLLEHRLLGVDTEWGIWRIEEVEAYFLNAMEYSNEEYLELGRIKGKRRLEWLAVRYLVHFMSGRKQRAAMQKEESGKPFLPNSTYHISISHSDGLVAAIASRHVVGIDIQRIIPKIKRIAYKFLSEAELDSLRPDHELGQLHLYWGAKECLYKAYGKKKLEFKSNLKIDPVFEVQKKGYLTGSIQKNDQNDAFEIWYEWIDDYMLVWAKAV